MISKKKTTLTALSCSVFHVRLPPDGNNDTQDKQEKQETGKTKGHLVVRPNSVQKTNRQVTHYLIKHLQKKKKIGKLRHFNILNFYLIF